VSFQRDGDASKERVGILLRNDGLGPAQIVETRIYYDNERVGDWEDVTKRNEMNYAGRTPFWTSFKYGTVIRSGDHIALYATSPNQIRDINQFRRLIWERLFIIVKVCSLYDDCYHACTHVDDKECEQEEKRRMAL
jgi:hypothetical protein